MKPDASSHCFNMEPWQYAIIVENLCCIFAQFPFIFSRQKNVPFFLTLTKSFSLKLAVKVIREPRGTHTALENKAKMDF